MTIRVAQLADLNRIKNIYGHYVLHSDYTFDTHIPDERSLAETMNAITERHAYLVIEEEEKVQGYAYTAMHRKKAAYDWVCEITIYMDYSAKGKGLGKPLYQALINIATVQGYHSLLAGITVPNEMSERFHAHFGFVPSIRYDHIGFKGGKWKDVIWWRKELRDLNEDPKPIRPVTELTPQELKSAGLS